MDRRRRSALGRTTAALAAFVFSALALLLGGPSPALGAVARERRQLGVNYLDALNQGYQGWVDLAKGGRPAARVPGRC